MGHDEAQARQAALVKFVRLMKASANDMVSEVEAISYTGDITQLTNYELTVVISQLQAQLCSNLNPHRTAPEPTPAPEPTRASSWMYKAPSPEQGSNWDVDDEDEEEPDDEPAPEPAPEPEPATREQRRAARQAQLEQQILNSADGWTSNGKNEKISLFSLFQEVNCDYDALHDALKCYSNCELARCAHKNKLDGWNEWDKNQLVEALVTFVKNQRESWGTPTPDWEPAPVEAWKTRMQQITKYGGASNQPTPTPAPAPEPERKRLSLFSLFQEVGLDSDALHEALKTYNKPELVRNARLYKLAGKTALLKMTTHQLIEELVKYAVREVNRGSCFLKDDAPEPARVPKTRKPQRGEPADWKTQHLVVQGVVAGEPEPGLSWLDNPEAFTL